MSDVLDPLRRFMEDGDEIDGDDAHAIVEHVDRLTRELAEAKQDAASQYSRRAADVDRLVTERDAARQERNVYIGQLDSIARALGCVHQQSMGPDHPGSAAEVLASIDAMQRDNGALRAMMPSERELLLAWCARDSLTVGADRLALKEWLNRITSADRLSPPSAPAQDAPIDRHPEGFCACGRRTSECDRSRRACASSEAL